MQTKVAQTNSPIAPCCNDIFAIFEPALFKALADASRVAILANLAIAGTEQSVSQVAASFDLNLSVVSRHLKTLKDADILQVRKTGKEVRYRVNSQILASALRSMANVLERCCPDDCNNNSTEEPNDISPTDSNQGTTDDH